MSERGDRSFLGATSRRGSALSPPGRSATSSTADGRAERKKLLAKERNNAEPTSRVQALTAALLFFFTSSFFFSAWATAVFAEQSEIAPAARVADSELLAASDLFAAAPMEFRVEVEVRQGGAESGMPLEIWRHGEDLALVRLLAERDRGKFLLRRDRELYFIAPGSARPVKLAPSYRLQGAALDELLGLRLVRDFRIEKVTDGGGVVTFDLVANDKGAAAPRLRWAVSRAKRLPLRADLQASDGQVLRVIEFPEWADPRRGVPKRMVVKEVLRGGAPLEIRFGEFESRPVSPGLFDLENGAARAALSKAP